MRHNILTALAILAPSVGLTAILAIRLNHPAMTETQLFIAFWPYWLGCAGFCVAALLLIRELSRQSGAPHD